MRFRFQYSHIVLISGLHKFLWFTTCSRCPRADRIDRLKARLLSRETLPKGHKALQRLSFVPSDGDPWRMC